MNPLVATALATNQDNLALGNDTFVAGGARFIRNTTYPTIRDANHIDTINARTPVEIDALLTLAEREYTHTDMVRFDVDPRTPPEFEAALVLAGYTHTEALVFLLEGALVGTPKPFDIRLITSEQQWAAFRELHALDWEAAAKFDVEVEPAMAAVMRLKTPPTRYWLGYIDGVPRGYLNSWEGSEGVGQVETLFVHPEFRHHGLATALLHHCVTDSRVHGAGPTVIVASPDDTPKQMYAALGWRPIAIKREYHRAH